MIKTNIFENLKISSSQEVFETIIENNKIKIERIISNGQITPHGIWYDQELNEFVTLLKGKATIILKKPNRTINLKGGDFLIINAHEKHRVEYTSKDALWLALHY